MKIIEIVNGVLDGSISINYYAHHIDDFKESLERIYRGAGTVRASNDSVNDFEIHDGERFWHTSYSQDGCRNCGERLYFILSGKELQLRGRQIGSKSVSLDRNHICSLAKRRPICGEIKVTSNLLFVNYFGLQDTPDGLEYDQRWSLQSIAGMINITTYKSKYHNIACGQMGNMSVGIYVHPNKKSIIVGNPFVADHALDKMSESMNMTIDEYEKYATSINYDDLSMIEGHKLVDTISLEVWRWEATDVATFGKCGLPHDVVELDVEHGVWAFEHYYTTRVGDYDNIYSRFTLKE